MLNSVESILILIFCIFYYFEQIRSPQTHFIYTQQSFWVTGAIFIFTAGTFFVFLFRQSSVQVDGFIDQFAYIHALLYLLRNILFSITMFIPSEKKGYTDPPLLLFNLKTPSTKITLQPMFFLQATSPTNTTYVVYFGTFGMLLLAVGLIVFIVFHQRKVIYFQLRMKKMQEDQQQMMLQASIQSQEEERQRIAADLHDDAGPLLATVRLYLNEGLIHQDQGTQLQSIYNAKQIIDDTIQLIRNMSHNLIPPTLKNFGLESAVNDMFQKINGSGSISASARFHDYKRRLKLEYELSIFRVLQELVNNILKHSHSSFIHLTQNKTDQYIYIRMHHDGEGLTQTEYEKLRDTPKGMGLKNIFSRVKILNSKILFEKDSSNTYYKVTIEIPVEAML